MTLLFTSPLFLEHDTGQHPESAARLKAIFKALDNAPALAKIKHQPIVATQPEQLLRVHSAEHIQNVKAHCEQGGGRLDADTVASRRSYDVALHAAGTACAAVDQVLTTAAGNALVLARPPGHHALPNSAMGFCLFNNVAIAARQAIQIHHLNRVLIVDWDVHHGNGTQDIFYSDEQVWFFSAHRYPFYPGTGSQEETGTAAGLGTIFNAPIEFGISRSDYRKQFQNMLEQAAARCRPELILISAGFDAHAADPIGSLGLESEDFADLTRDVLDVADQYCDGKVVSLLEGGYNTTALAESVVCHLETLIAATT